MSLIVDFPQCRYVVTTPVSYRARRRAVQFKSMHEVQYFEREKSVGDCWYTGEDYKSFKANNKEAIQKVHKTYIYLFSDQVQVDDAGALNCCLAGIENL